MKKINLKTIFASMLMIMLCPIVINAEEGYYYVGTQTGWDLSNKTYKFSKMDDGKTWTLTMPIDSSDDFQIAPLSVESWNDSRYKVAEGSSGLSGMMNFSPFDGTNFSVSTEKPSSYTIKIVPSELTYEISLEGSSITYKDGDSFTAKTKEGVDMGFQVISTTNMTCGVSGNAIAKDTEGHVTIPDTVNGFSVVSIGTEKGFGSFNSCKNLKSITIPNSITSIMFGSFYGCSSLTKVILNSNAITSITFGNYPYNNIESFFGSQVSEYVIGDDVISIGEHAFYNCDSLKTVTIGNSVTNIGDAAFYSCHSLKTVTIGNSVTSIGKYAFSNCISMTSVNITDLTAWCGIKFNEKDSNPLYYAMHLFLNDEEVKDLIIPEGLTNISEYAFTNCGDLMSVYIPNSVTSISYRAFYGCSNLAKVTLNSNTIISNNYRLGNIFGSQVSEYVVRDDLTSIGNYVFYGCSGLTSINIPNSVTSIGEYAFNGCSGLTSINFPGLLTNIGNNAFENCSSLASVYIPSSLTTIGTDAFKGCSNLSKVYVADLAAWCGISFEGYDGNNNPLSIAHHLYREDGAEITDLVIPEGVESISDFAFYGGSGLTSVTVPASLKKIGSSAFSGCSNLSKVTVSDLSAWCATSFGDNPLSYAHRLYDADGTEIQDLTIPAGVEGVSSGAFSGCESLKSLVISNGVKYVGGEAFANCRNLGKVVIPNSVESIGYRAFENCMSLYSVTSLINLPFNLTNSAFQCTTGNYDKDIIYMNAKLYVPRGLVTMYSNIEGWKKFTNIFETDTKFTLTYVLDGEVYKTYEIQAAEIVTPEPDPYKEGYIFSGWSRIPSIMPAEDVTVYGSFAVDPNYAGIDWVTDNETKPKAYYSVDGKRLETEQKGLNIIRMSDGTTRKVVVK